MSHKPNKKRITHKELNVAQLLELCKSAIDVVNNAVIVKVEKAGSEALGHETHVYVRPYAGKRFRCPVCGRKCPGYDRGTHKSCWRSRDLADGTKVFLHAELARIECPEHGVRTEDVPWALPDSRFTVNFDLEMAYIAVNSNRSAAASKLRVDWKTVGRAVSRVHHLIESDIKKRYKGLTSISIDETSYRKGHSCMTCVVNSDTNTVVWAADGHGVEVLSRFFEELTDEQKQSIKTVAGDGARWIDACISRYIPHAVRCLDPFHVVQWANDALDKVRLEAYRSTLKAAAELSGGQKLELSSAAEKIKGALYPLGKNPENLTVNQQAGLEFIADTCPKLYRAYELKELLRLVFKELSAEAAEPLLQSFFWRAAHSRLEPFKQLGHKIKRRRQNILNAIKYRMSSAKSEAINNKIKLLIRKAYGFRNIDSLLDFVLLVCSDKEVPQKHIGSSEIKAMYNS